MLAHKLTLAACMCIQLGVALGQDASPTKSTTAPPAPTLTDSQRAFLSTVARRTVRDAFLKRPVYELSYVPSALRDLSLEVVVRLRLRGYLLAHAAAGPKPIAYAVRDGALSIGQAVQHDATIDLATVNRMLIEIEAVGASAPIIVSGDWTAPGALDGLIDPGVHGLSLRGARFRHRICPTELYTTDLTLDEALRRLVRENQVNPSDLDDVELSRFRTAHWYEPRTGGDIVALSCGMTHVPLKAVTPAGLDQTISTVAEYMRYRQLDSGLFAYQFEPGHDRYTHDNSTVRQVGAAVALAFHAASTGNASSRKSADIAIRGQLKGLTNLPGVADASYIATPDAKNSLGATALVCLAMGVHPNRAAYAVDRDRLVRAILSRQRPSGMFLTAFPPNVTVNAQDYYPGEALLALAVHYSLQPSSRALDAFDHAVNFYRDYFRDTPSPVFVPWQVQAYSIMARQSKRADFRKFVFDMTDRIVALQLDSSNCDRPELFGGIAATNSGRPNFATAAYLEAMADALSLARTTENQTRIERYERAVRRAARFVMQLQMRPEEAYFVRSAQDAVGGIRTSPALNLLRIDHCHHALVGLIKARKALFPGDG